MVRARILVLAAAVSLLSTAAFAGDLPVLQPSSFYDPAVFCWSGIYLGGNVGGAWAQRVISDNFFGLSFEDGDHNASLLAGGQIGFNVQFGNFVLGAEWDLDWAANTNNTGIGLGGVFVPDVGTIQVSSRDTWTTTLAARLDVAVDTWLFYGKAGGGWVGNSGLTVLNATTEACIAGSASETRSGWLVGAGMEWAFTNNWSAKIEYEYLGLSSRTFIVPNDSAFLAGDTFNTGDRNF